MKIKKHKFSFIGLSIAALFWFIDSCIHYYLYGEPGFEIIPSDLNELWMRSAIIFLIVGFGIYVDITFNRVHELQNKQYQLQLKLDEALTKLLSGFVSICCVCKKVRVSKDQKDGKEIWDNIETYIAQCSDIKFSHGYCPECEEVFNKEIDDRTGQRRSERKKPL